MTTEPIMSSATFRTIRRAMGRTKPEIARMLSVTPRTVDRWENPSHLATIPTSAALQLTEAYGRFTHAVACLHDAAVAEHRAGNPVELQVRYTDEFDGAVESDSQTIAAAAE